MEWLLVLATALVQYGGAAIVEYASMLEEMIAEMTEHDNKKVSKVRSTNNAVVSRSSFSSEMSEWCRLRVRY